MSFSVDVLRRSSHLQGLVVVLLLQLLVTVVGDTHPSHLNARNIASKRSADDSNEVYNSKQLKDLPSDIVLHPSEYYGEDLDQLRKAQQKPSSNIISDHHQRSVLPHDINNIDIVFNRAIEEVYNSKDTLQQYDPETYLQLKKSSRTKPYEDMKTPLRIIVIEKPQITDKKQENLYYGPLFKGLGDNKNSEEVINQIIGTRNNNVGSEIKSPLKNAFLTKFTSYNITHVRDDKHNENFFLEKRYNSSSDIRYLDSKNRSTNYSDTHSSSLKTILDPEMIKQDSDISPSREFLINNIRNTEGNKNELNKNIKIPTKNMSSGPHDISDDDTFTKNSVNQKTKVSTDSNPNVKDNDNEQYYAADTDTLKGASSKELTQNQITSSQNNFALNDKRLLNTPSDFVGGQFMSRQDKANLLATDLPLPYNQQNGPGEFVGGQFVGEPQNKDVDDGLEVQNNFLGDKIVGSEGRDNFFEDLTTNSIGVSADFVGGQFIGNSESKSTLPSLEAKDYPANVISHQLMDGSKYNNANNLTETNEYENNKESLYNDVEGQFMHDQMKTNILDITTETTSVHDLTAISEYKKFDLASDNKLSQANEDRQPHLEDEKYDTVSAKAQSIKDITPSREPYSLDTLLQNQLKEFDLYEENKEPTPYLEMVRIQSDNENLKSNPNTNLGEREDLPISVPDNNQSNPENSETTTVNQINDPYEVISILGVPQTEDNNSTEEPVQKDNATISVLKGSRGNNRTIRIKNKPILPQSRPNKPYKGMSSHLQNQNIPITVFSEDDNKYEPTIINMTNNWNGPFTLSPSNKDNVVFKTSDGDTEIVVSVLSSPDDELENKSQGNNITENETANSEYDEYLEDDERLGSSNLNESHSILEKDPDTNHYVTELVANYFTNQFSTEPSNLIDLVNSYVKNAKTFSSALPDISDVTRGSIVGDSSDFYSNNLNPETLTSSPLPFNGRNNHTKISSEPPVLPVNFSDKPTIVEDVELYAGSPLHIYLNNDDKQLEVTDSTLHSEIPRSSKDDSIIDSTKSKDHLSELCIPLTNEKYISLLDLLSGPFYLDKNGNKIAMSLRGDQKKNCTLNSKQCKLFLDLKQISNSLNSDSSTKDKISSAKIKHEKRHIEQKLSRNENSDTHPSDSSYEFGMQTSGDNLNSDKIFSNNTESTIQQSLKFVFNDGLSSTKYKEGTNQNQEAKYTSNLISTVTEMNYNYPIPNKTVKSSIYSKLNEKWNNLFNRHHRSRYHNQLNGINDPNDQPNPHKNRPARMIDVGSNRENDGEKCGCSQNEILRSASPFPHYKEFVAKRADILKNIVYTVSDWASQP